MDASAIRAAEDRHASGFYPKKPVVVVRGRGTRVWDDTGREYLDFASGHGVVNVGHAHPQVAEAVAAQMRAITVVRETYYSPPRAALVEALSARAGAGLERVFLCNSGAEAMECALKVARLATGRPEVVAARRSFHGRTLGALSITWEKKYREPFEPLVPGARFVAYERLEELEAAVSERTAAVVLEAVQGEGGVHPGSAAYLRGAAAVCRERGALLVLDEVQTGLGRTGRFLAREHHGIEPDVLTLGKGLAGGLPVGAALIGPRVPPLPALAHGSTLGGGPVVCAAALAVLDVIEKERLVDNAREVGAAFLARLAKVSSPLVKEVRGLGLMIGVDLRRRAAPVLEGLMRRGVLAIAAGPTVVRFLPPLVVTREEVERAVTALEEALGDVAAAAPAGGEDAAAAPASSAGDGEA